MCLPASLPLTAAGRRPRRERAELQTGGRLEPLLTKPGEQRRKIFAIVAQADLAVAMRRVTEFPAARGRSEGQTVLLPQPPDLPTRHRITDLARHGFFCAHLIAGVLLRDDEDAWDKVYLGCP